MHMDAQFFLRLSPLRRPLDFPFVVDTFAFYVPWSIAFGDLTWDDEYNRPMSKWERAVQNYVAGDSYESVTDNMPELYAYSSVTNRYNVRASIQAFGGIEDEFYPGLSTATAGTCAIGGAYGAPYIRAYDMIYDHYFRDTRVQTPFAQDLNGYTVTSGQTAKPVMFKDWNSGDDSTTGYLDDYVLGRPVWQLEDFFTTGGGDQTNWDYGYQDNSKTLGTTVGPPAGAVLQASDVNELQIQNLFEREHDLTANRYRDQMSKMFGGHVSADRDFRPQLIAHSRNMQHGADVNGTGDDSLGAYTGKSAGSHRLDRDWET